MTLTLERMESSNESLNYGAYVRDVANMDQDQLGTYLRKSFTSERDLNFLPAVFWDYWIDMDTFGLSHDGRTPPGPGASFAEIHDVVGAVENGTYSIVGQAADFEFRARFRSVLRGFLYESLAIKGEPDEKQKMLAAHACEAVANLQTPGNFVIFGLEQKAKKETTGADITMPRKLVDDLLAFSQQYPVLRDKANMLIENPRFQIPNDLRYL